MNGKTYAYLDIAALPDVGPALLDPRPAFVFRSDGSGVVWANAAGAAFFGDDGMTALLDRRFPADGAFALQIQRLAKQIPAEHPRLEMLRFNFGVRQLAMPALCRRLALADGARAMLAIAAGEAPRESLSTRAERLADSIAGETCLVAVLDGDGKVLGASGGFDRLQPASAEIDLLVDELVDRDRSVVKRAIDVEGGTRAAGVARIGDDAARLYLLIVGPEEQRRPEPRVEAAVGGPEPAALPPPPPASDLAEAAPAVATAPEPPPAPTRRFLWQVDRDLRFSHVSPDLADVVGEATAAILGKTWREVDAALRLDPTGAVRAALKSHADWNGLTVHWPLEEVAERVAVDLSALSVGGRRGFAGYRGFGVIRLADRRPDDRAAMATDDEDVEAAAPPPPPAADIAPKAAAEPPPPIVEAAPPEAAPAPAVSEPADAAPRPRRPIADEDLDDAARKSIEAGSTHSGPAEAARDVEVIDVVEVMPGDVAAAAGPGLPPPPLDGLPLPQAGETAATAGDREPAPSNVVHLPASGRSAPRRLSGTEQDAFRRIAEALGAQPETKPAAPAERTPPATPDVAPPTPAPAAAEPAPDMRLFDKLGLGVVIYRDETTHYANRAALDLLGYQTVDAFVAAGGGATVFPERDPRLAEGGVFAARRSGGGAREVLAKLDAVAWGDATALMLTLSPPPPRVEPPPPPEAIDVVDQAAAHRIAELEAILDTATDGVVVIDGEGRIESLNRAAEALFGIPSAEVGGRPFTGLLAEESRKAALDYLDGLSSNGVASVLNDGREVIGKVPRGGLIPLFMTMGRIAGSGKYCAVLRDITHWKNVEDELVAARRAAEAANAQKSDFLAKISHEIRTPLNAIIGFSEVMIEQRFGPIGNDRYRDYLRDIHLSGQHLMSLINDLLDLSKIEAGKLDLNFESVAPNEVIQECVALMQPQANRERIIIRTSLSAGVPNVVADLRSLRQILLNLLSNAIKFTRAGGQVIVATALEESGEVVVRVRDTGIGMSDKDIETAMKPFRQVATSGRAREGTGLGLPLTKALVEANRATFAIDSVPNQGTLVRITFPTTRVLAG